MSQASSIVRGRILPDGTLELAERPGLPAGPVEVTIRPAPVADPVPDEDWWDCLQRLLAERDASGFPERTKEEIDAEIDELRSGWDDKIDEAHRRIEAARHGEEI